MSCFNKNTKLYKDLMEQTEGNESLVTAILVHYNGDLTNVFKTRTELREALKIRSNPSDSDIIKLYKRIGQYNKINGTSHSLLKRQRGEADLYDIKLKINYLPRNFFAHIMRTAMRKEDGTWYNMETETSFTNEDVRGYNNVNTPAISPGERYRDPRNARFTETESDLGYFDENGDFKPKADYNNTDYILNTNINFSQFIKGKLDGSKLSQEIEGKLEANKDRLIDLLGSSMYSEKLKDVVYKELLQNAFDAVKIAKSKNLIEKGKIDIEINEKERVISFTDNGIGMTSDIVQKAFFTIGGTYKGDDVDNTLKSGGLGLAKMAFIFGSEKLELETVKDGIKTIVNATSEDIRKDNFKIKTEFTNEKNGTKINVKIPKTYIDAKGENREIDFPRFSSTEFQYSFLSKPLIGEVDVNYSIINRENEYTKEEKIKTNLGKIPEGYVLFSPAKTNFADIDIYIDTKNITKGNFMDTKHEILSSGLYQFNIGFKKDNDETIPLNIIIDIKPKVDATNSQYPFNNQRENFKPTVKNDINALNKYLALLWHSIEVELLKSSFAKIKNIDSVDINNIDKSVIEKNKEIVKNFKSLSNSDIINSAINDFNNRNEKAFIESGGLKTKEFSLTKEDIDKEKEKSYDRTFQAEKKIQINKDTGLKLNSEKPIIHNNTNMNLTENSTKFLSEISSIMIEYKKSIIDFYGEDYSPNIKEQLWGVSIDKNYGGINVNPSFLNMLAINPFYNFPTNPKVDAVNYIAVALDHLIIHELNHNFERNEGAGFTGRFLTTYSEIHSLPNYFELISKLKISIKNNLETIKNLNYEYEQSENVESGFEGNNFKENNQRRTNNGNDSVSKNDTNRNERTTKYDTRSSEKFGEIISKKENIDYILPTAPDKLVRLVDKKLQLLNSKILSLREELAKTEDITKIKSLEREIAKYRNKVEEIKGNRIDISKTENYEQIVNNAEQELSKIQKLLGQSTITLADLKYASEITDFWIKVGTFTTPENHPLLDAVEFDSDVIREIFGSIRTKYERVNMEILRLEKEHLEEYAKEKGSKSTYEQLIAPMEDLSKAFIETRWSGKADDELLQILANSIEQATIKGFNESNLVWKELDRMSKNVITEAKSLGTSVDGNPFSVFKQFTKNGKETGKGVHLWTDEFFKTKAEKRRAAFFTKDKNGNIVKNKSAIDDYYKFINEDTVTMDPRMLFPDSGDIDSAFIYNRVTFSENDKKKHQEELKKHLGEYSYEKYYTRLQKNIDKFKLQREAIWESIQEKNLEESDKKDLMNEWLRENSPYWTLDMTENPAMRIKPDNRTYYTSKGHEYTYEIPKREKNGKETGWYDKNFDKIVNNESLLEFYEYYTDLLISLKKIFPEEKQKMLGMNVIPTLEKTLMDTFTEKGMMGSYSLFKDKIKEAVSVSELGTTSTESDRQIQTKFIIDNKARIVDALKLEILKIENLQGRKVTLSERNEIQERIVDEMSKEKSWDLIKILKGYSLMALTYKQKLMIEPQVRLIEKVFQERQEIKTNRAGVPLLDKDGNIDLKTKEESLKNTKDAIEFVTNSEFYGISTRKVEGKSKKKQYTKAEEVEKTELEQLKESVTDPVEKVLVQKKIDSLGHYVALSEIGDSLLRYNQLLSLGWNIPSAVNNLSFGIVANFIEGSGGIHYNNTKLRKAYMLATNSIAKNATFNSWEGVNGNATKIRSLMDKMDLLKSIVNETYEPSIKSTTGKLKRFGPMSMQERTEYLNYAPVMIAIMDSEKADGTPIFSATDPEGKEVSIWEAYGLDGELQEGFTTTVDEVLLTQKIKRVLEMNHGDYTRTTKVQNKFTGRMMMQFRKWMIEGFASRFEEGKPDIGLSYGLDEPFIRKGRYRSYTQGQLGVTGATIGTLVLPGIGTAIGAGVGYLGGKFFGLQTEQNAIGDTLFTLKQLLRKLTFRSTEFDKQFNKTDAANMRKNFQELAIMTTLYLVVLGLAKGLGDDDDEKNKAFAAVMLINQGNRLITDIEFYTNPLALEKLSKSAIPMTRLVQASSNWFKAVGEQFDGDPDNDYMQSGTFEDWNKVGVRTFEAFPFTTAITKAAKFSTQVFD